MAKISFKAKIQTMYNMDDTIAFQFIQVPELKRHHCDMGAFRSHPKYGGLANSDLFPNILRGISKSMFNGGVLRMDLIPDGVTVDTSSFLARVEFDA